MKLEIRPYSDPETGNSYDAIYIDGELFDWGIDSNELAEAKKIVGENPFLKQSVLDDIQNFFISSFSDFVGKPVTINELLTAIKVGKI